MAKQGLMRGRLRNRVRELREREGWSMDELAARCDPPTQGSMINKLEKGHRKLTLEWMLRLSDALGVHPNELLPEPAPSIDREEQAVVDLYRGLSEPDRRAFRRVVDALAQSAGDGVNEQN